MCYVQLHKYPDAEPFFERAKKLVTEAEKSHTERRLLNSLFNCYLLQGKFAKAISIMPDQVRAENESTLTTYADMVSNVVDLAKHIPWPGDKEK
jgi:hypothetical protein